MKLLMTICLMSFFYFTGEAYSSKCAGSSADLGFLSDKEFSRLFRSFKAGDLKAREHLLMKYMPFVEKLAFVKAKEERRELLGDFIQEGVLGLMEALDRFDPLKGRNFEHYARWWIHLFMNRMLPLYYGPFVVKSYFWQSLWVFERSREKLTMLLGRDPSREEIASRIGKTIGWVDQLLERKKTLIPLALRTEVLIEEQQFRPREENGAYLLKLYLNYRENLSSLRDRFLFDYYFLGEIGEDSSPRSFRQMSRDLSLSGPRVQQIHQRLKKGLIKFLRVNLPLSYFEENGMRSLL